MLELPQALQIMKAYSLYVLKPICKRMLKVAKELIAIQAQIDSLQKKAADIKAREFASTVQEILAKMAAFGITAKDLQAKAKGKAGAKSAAKAAKAVKSAKSKKAGIPVAAKYRGANGETWSGRGLMPKWLKMAVDAGQAKESFLIAAD